MSTKTKGVAESVLRAARKLERNPIDPQGLLSKGTVREFIMAGICPFCGIGPLTLLARHTNVAHGVDRFELRERAGLFKYSSITPDGFHQQKVAAAKQRGMPTEALHALDEWRESGAKRSESEASRDLRVALLNKFRPPTPKRTPEQVALAVEKMRAAQTQKRADRDARIIEAVMETNRPMKEIAAGLGIHPKTVRDALKRSSLQIDGRTRRDRSAEI